MYKTTVKNPWFLSFNDYLKNLRDIEETNILYSEPNKIDEHIKNIFININY